MALCTDISERQMHVLIIINMKNDFASSPSRNLSQTISGGDQQWYTFARFCNIIASETKLQKKSIWIHFRLSENNIINCKDVLTSVATTYSIF